MRYRLPPLNSLRLFEASARLLSFKAAAEELLVTPSAVSHGIQSLEVWLGAVLFERTSRGLVLTEAGSSYYPTVRDALASLVAGSDRVSGRHNAMQIAISAAPTFAARWLVPRLPKFREKHPDIAVVIDTAHDRTELSDAGVDLAIRMGQGGWPGLVADRLLTEELVPVCAPAIFERVKNLGALDDAPLVHITTVSEDWPSWAAATGRPQPNPMRGALRYHPDGLRGRLPGTGRRDRPQAAGERRASEWTAGRSLAAGGDEQHLVLAGRIGTARGRA